MTETTISQPKNTSSLYVFSFFCALTMANLTLILSLPNSASLNIPKNLGWPQDEMAKKIGQLGFAFQFSLAIGCFVLSRFFSNYSRNKVLITTCLILVAANCSFLFVESFTVFMIINMINGPCVGIQIVAVSKYARELVPPQISGRVVAMQKLGNGFGLLLSFGLGFILPDDPQEETNLLKLLFVLPAILAVSQLIFFTVWFRHDTPIYYLENGREQEAKNVIEMYNQSETVERVFSDTKAEIEHEKTQDTSNQFSNYKKQFLVALFVGAMLEIQGTNLLVLYSSKIMSAETERSDVWMTYEEVKLIRETNLLSGGLQIVWVAITMFLLDKLGRRWLYSQACLLSFACLLFLGISLSMQSLTMQKIGIMVNSMAIGLGFQTINDLYYSEILPISLNSFTVGIVNFFYTLLILMYSEIGQSRQGFMIYVFVIAGLNFIAFFVSRKVVVETKGLTLNQIYNKFNGEEEKSLEKEDQEEEREVLMKKE